MSAQENNFEVLKGLYAGFALGSRCCVSFIVQASFPALVAAHSLICPTVANNIAPAVYSVEAQGRFDSRLIVL